MKKIGLYVCVLALILTTTGCGNETSSDETNKGGNSVEITEMFTDRDYNTTYDTEKSAHIRLNGDSVDCESDAVKISGTIVTIKDEGTYILSGTLNDGMVVVDADEKDKPQIVLDNANINSNTSAAIYVIEADKVVVTLAEGSNNTLSNGGDFVAIDKENIDATIYSKQDLSINGEGNLTVTSPVGHGIVSKDDLVFTSGVYTVESASHGVDANDSVRITNSEFIIDAGKDGIHAENNDDETLGFVYIEKGSFDISAEGDGISAGAYMTIEDGTYNIVTGGGSAYAEKQTSDGWGGFGGGMHNDQPGGKSFGNKTQDKTLFNGGTENTQNESTDDSSTSIKAIKATADLTINNGNFTIDSADDSIHSNASVTVNKGTFEIAAGDDAFHADEILTINDGTINVTTSYEGLEGLEIYVSGGDISLVTTDDGINAAGGTDESGFGGARGGDKFGGGLGGSSNSNGKILISGGKLYINVSGDGIDANGSFEISGGEVIISGATQGDTAVLDYDNEGIITGGTFIGTGSLSMAQTFSSSKQGVLAINAGNRTSNEIITVSDSKGKEIISYEADQSYTLIIVSTPDLVSGETYTINIGDASGEIRAN